MENFKIPHLDKAVGIPTGYDNHQSDFEKKLINKFKKGGEKYEGKEIEKTEKDIELIKFTEEAVDFYMDTFKRGKKVDIPIENIHIFKEGVINGPLYDLEYVSVVIPKTKTNIDFSLKLFHELAHAKSFAAMQVTKGKNDNDRKVEAYRLGFSVVSRDGKQKYFNDVNEAVIGMLTENFYRKYIEKSELFKDEVKKINDENIDINFGRNKEVKDLLMEINKIYELNKGKYSLKEIVTIFIEAGISGKLIKVARLIEETFGEGSFREYGEKTGKIYN